MPNFFIRNTLRELDGLFFTDVCTKQHHILDSFKTEMPDRTGSMQVHGDVWRHAQARTHITKNNKISGPVLQHLVAGTKGIFQYAI